MINDFCLCKSDMPTDLMRHLFSSRDLNLSLINNIAPFIENGCIITAVP